MSLSTRTAAAVGLLLAPVLAGSDEPTIRVKLVNASRHVLREAYVSPSGSPSWGPNLLSRQGAGPARRAAVQAGQRFVLGISSECGKFDIRLVADGGTEFLEDEVDLCAEDGVLTVTNRALAFTQATLP